jgi:predicted metal-dependent phosphoesterase TrpH
VKDRGRDRAAALGSAARTADLHTHSTASDGTRAPSALIAGARAVGLAIVALTDHDTVNGLVEAERAGRELGVTVVAGVELSATEDDREVHLLGLHLADLDSLRPSLEALQGARRRRADRMIEALNAIGVPLQIDAVMAEAGSGAVGRPHVARALIGAGWARDQRDAFDRYLGAGRPAFVAKPRLSVADAIRLIHDAGGVAVLAHPAREGTLERLSRLQQAGLDGVEVRHPSHSAEDEARLSTIAVHLGLVSSGGSDWHGALEGPRVIGAITIPASWVDEQLDRAHAYRRNGSDRWSSAAASLS